MGTSKRKAKRESTHTVLQRTERLHQHTSDDLKSPLRRTRSQHSEQFQVPNARAKTYKHSFFPKTIRDWNALPASVISSAECAEDYISKFTSLMRSRD